MPSKESPDDLLSKYEALEYRKRIGKKTSLITLNNAVAGRYANGKPLPPEKRLVPAYRFQVAPPSKSGKTRTFDVFTRRSLDEWKPGSRDTEAPLRNAAKLLGITLEEAREMAGRAEAKRDS
jgi:hypothetical protein